jgi:hypothetical protein
MRMALRRRPWQSRHRCHWSIVSDMPTRFAALVVVGLAVLAVDPSVVFGGGG